MRRGFRVWIVILMAASIVRAEELKKLVLGPDVRHERLAIGINYTGAQARLGLSPRWSLEGRYQRGKASSNYGDVTAHVVGLRAYRFYRSAAKVPLYLGSEAAFTTAKPERSYYKTSGFAGGLFGGFEFPITKRISLNADLGPYVISLTESQTRLRSTNLDFVLNTALLVRLF